MLNRRHLRIKILHVLYAFYQDEERDVVKTKKALDHSIDKMQELYLLLLLMIGSMQSFAIDRIEAGRKKRLPTPEDLHPNTKFCLLYTSPSPRDLSTARMPSSA